MSQIRNIATEVMKPLEQAADCLGFVLADEVLAAEVVVLGAVAQHVEGSGEHRGGDGEDGLSQSGQTYVPADGRQRDYAGKSAS